MDEAEGDTLQSLIISTPRGQYWPEEKILDIFVQLCLGLKHMHDRKTLHRDLNSRNIFVTENGDVQIGGFCLKNQEQIDFKHFNYDFVEKLGIK